MRKKPGELKKFALEAEKLQNWNIKPKKVEIIFDNIYNNKKKKYSELIGAINNASRTRFTGSERNWNKFLERVRSGDKLQEGEMDRYKNAINTERLGLMGDIADFRIQAVIYLPQFAEDWLRGINKIYHNISYDRSNVADRVSRRREKIRQFESLGK